MTIEIRVSKNSDIVQHLIDANTKEQVIDINELDFIFLTVLSDVHVPVDEISLTIGNTSFLFDEPTFSHAGYSYPLKFDRIRALLPGISDHLSNTFLDTLFGKRQFYRLFLNEIGISNLYINNNGEEKLVGKIRVTSSKITQDNYTLITEYLIINNYFDSNFLYKVVIEGDQGNVNNSLIEALRKLLEMLSLFKNNLRRFEQDAIYSLGFAMNVVPYHDELEMGQTSVDWLINNLDNIQSSPKADAAFLVRSRGFIIDNILVENPVRKYDSYENRCIHGFLITLHRAIFEMESTVFGKVAPKTRISSFRDYLLQCFYSIITVKIGELKHQISLIKNYFETNIPVDYPIFGFPTKVDSFLAKSHYNEIFQIMLFSKSIFSIELGNNNLSLEIESFDKLFEVYCFFLIRDVISNKFNGDFEKQFSFTSPSNKDAGIYKLVCDDSNINITLYYEGMPESIVQYSHGDSLRPDFIISIFLGSVEYCIILDAKFKNYSRNTRDGDFANTALKYLHKIGPKQPNKTQVTALILLSLGNVNKPIHFYTKEYNLYGKNPILPHIANIEIDPKSFQLSNNILVDLLDYHIAMK